VPEVVCSYEILICESCDCLQLSCLLFCCHLICLFFPVLEFLILLCENYALYLKDFGVSQVREIVSILDIDALFYPCPKNGPTFRPKAIEMGGKKQFPYMVCALSPVCLHLTMNLRNLQLGCYGHW